MRYQNLSLTATLILSLTLASAAQAQAQVTEQNVRALTTMQSVNIIGGFVRDWCFARAPQTKAAVSAGFNGWRQDTKLDVFEKTLLSMSPEAVQSLKNSLEAGRAKMYAELDKAAQNPAQECLGIRAYLNGQLNAQKLYPNEYAAALKVKAAPAQTSTPSASPQTQGSAAPSASPSGKLGGPLTLGTYNCRSIRTSGSNPPRVYSLNIYGNGEWRQVIDGKEITTSVYKYDSKTGKINISMGLSLTNSDYDEDEFAYFMADKSGAAIIYGEEDYGLGVTKVTCAYAGANKLPSPEDAKALKAKQDAAKAAAQAEADRFKWVTAPNKGVQLNQIEALLHTVKNDFSSGSKLKEDWVLLLKDGWAYNGLRITPADLDVKKSRQNEPNQWQKWRKQGGNYQALNAKTGQWQDIKGSVRLPAAKGERISGLYQNFSMYSAGNWEGAYKSSTTLSASFSKDGKFSTSSYDIGGVGAGDTSSTSVNTANKSGCTSATSTTARAGNSAISTQNPTVAAGGSSRNTNCDTSNFVATYTLDGYTIERRYADGRVSRDLFFFWDKSKDSLFIGSRTYSRK